MKTVADLGRNYKKSHPGLYDDKNDEEVGRAVKAKYPGRYDDFEDTAVQAKPSQATQTRPREYPFQTKLTATEQQISELVRHYDPNMGKFSAWWKGGQAERRVKLLTYLGQEQVLLIQQASAIEREVMAGRVRAAEFQTFIARHAIELIQIQAQEQLINDALMRGYDLATWQKVKLEWEMSKLRTTEEREKTQTELDKETVLSSIRTAEERDKSGIKVQEHERLKKIDLDSEREQVRIALEGAERLKLTQHQLIDRLTDILDGMYTKRANLESGNDIAKADKLRRLNRNIEMLEGIIDARQERLLQEERGNQNRRTAEANSDNGRHYPPESDDD